MYLPIGKENYYYFYSNNIINIKWIKNPSAETKKACSITKQTPPKPNRT